MAKKKHIFIGLGGSGCQTVAQIKEKVYEKKFGDTPQTKSRLDAMNENYRFLFVDTDSRDIDEANKRNRTSFEYGRVPFIAPNTDLVNLGKGNPQAIWYEACQDADTLINKRILEACSPELAAKIPDQPLAFGAGAFRMKSRIAFAHALSDFQMKLQAAISALNDVKTTGGSDFNIYYWIICSSLGGTGSGIINDVLYHVNMMHRQTVGDGDPQLILTMYMPKIYIDQNNTEEKYTLNAYGVFSEINAFKCMSQEPGQNTVFHRMALVNDYNLIDTNRKYCPFYYLIPIDVQTDKGTSLGTQHEMYRNTAELLYHIHEGKGGETFRSDIDNYMNDIMERDHDNFLVPMGYVSLHKPEEQMRAYMRTRFKRDVLRDWLLNNNPKATVIEDNKKDALYKEVFGAIMENGDFYKAIDEKVQEITDGVIVDDSKDKLDENSDFAILASEIGRIKDDVFDCELKPENTDKVKEELVNTLWRKAEEWIREKGIVYAINAIDAVREIAKNKFDLIDKELSDLKNDIDNAETEAQKAYEDAHNISLKERTIGSNKDDITTYKTSIEKFESAIIEKGYADWTLAILKNFCLDEKTDELAKCKNHLTRFKNKAEDMNNNVLKEYKGLADQFGKASLDVTTVYLPLLKDICDANGWKANNRFSKLYNCIIPANEDAEAHAEREPLMKFINDNIYFTQDDQMNERIGQNEYVVAIKHEKKNSLGKKVEVVDKDNRFFASKDLERTPEKVIEQFLEFSQIAFEDKFQKTPEIQDRWINRGLSEFFNELNNDQKDEVRNSLNPALFFSYNSDRIDVMKKEEHMVFVANNKDLARQMLGYDSGNPKHRFEEDSNVNTALVIKSKFGLALHDYRIYDSIKMVYDKATFREKYHFHRDFAQHLGKITLADLPDEELQQHRVFAKILLLNAFANDLAPMFYKDHYEPENFANTLLIDSKIDPSLADDTILLACPEALSEKDGMLCLTRMEKNRHYYCEISGNSIAKIFDDYMSLFFNKRFADSLQNVLSGLTRTSVTVKENGNSVQKNGAEILKKKFREKREELLNELNQKKAKSQGDDRKVYGILFSIIKNRYDSYQKFIG